MRFVNASIDKENERVYKTDKNLSLYQSKLKFNFEHISLKKKRCCFNNNKVTSEDYSNLFDFLRFLSSYTVQQIIDDKANFHFHHIDLSIKYSYKQMFYNALNVKKNEDIPTFYQIAVFTDGKSDKARLIFSLDEDAVFNLMFYDYDHLIYLDNNLCKEEVYEVYKDYM